MELSQQQREAVSQWVAAGESLASVQRRLREEFSVSMTYMEVRFLVDDLGLELKSPEKPKPAAQIAGNPAPSAAATPASADGVDAPPPDADAEFAEDLADELAQPDAPAGGGVKVDVDRIVRPGAVVSGSVTFSDGKSATWALDQMGRLALGGTAPGYKPSQADIQAFQQELSMQLQRHGY